MRIRNAALLGALLLVLLPVSPVYASGRETRDFSCVYTSIAWVSVEKVWPDDSWVHWRGSVEEWSTVSGDSMCTGVTTHVTDGDWPKGGTTRARNHLELDAAYAGSGWDYSGVVHSYWTSWEGKGFGAFDGWQVRALGHFVSEEPFLYQLDFTAFRTAG